jgi:hypothetical protein
MGYFVKVFEGLRMFNVDFFEVGLETLDRNMVG